MIFEIIIYYLLGTVFGDPFFQSRKLVSRRIFVHYFLSTAWFFEVCLIGIWSIFCLPFIIVGQLMFYQWLINEFLPSSLVCNLNFIRICLKSRFILLLWHIIVGSFYLWPQNFRYNSFWEILWVGRWRRITFDFIDTVPCKTVIHADFSQSKWFLFVWKWCSIVSSFKWFSKFFF